MTIEDVSHVSERDDKACLDICPVDLALIAIELAVSPNNIVKWKSTNINNDDPLYQTWSYYYNKSLDSEKSNEGTQFHENNLKTNCSMLEDNSTPEYRNTIMLVSASAVSANEQMPGDHNYHKKITFALN